MSYFPCEEAVCSERRSALALRIEPRTADLGDFSVRRSLPSRQQRMVGPFVFFDHMGPAAFAPGKGIAVRPHPHIGIATITYLFEGEIMHRDSLGVVQPITAGAVNLMVAGRGIVHSERAGSDLDSQATLHGIQSWIALPEHEQEREPEFTHFPAASLPQIDLPGAQLRLIMGEAFGERSPVTTFSRTLYVDAALDSGARLELPDGEEELAVYLAEGAVEIDGERLETGVMAVARDHTRLVVRAQERSRLMVIGGDPLGPRAMYWNFVSSDRERIERAKRDWREGRFDPVPGDDEYIPLPE